MNRTGSVAGKRKRTGVKKYNYFYRCNSYDKLLGRKGCDNKYVSAEALEFTVWDFIERVVRNPQATIELYRQEQAIQEAQYKETEARLAAIDELLEENAQEVKRLQKMYQRGGCDDGYFDAEKSRLDGEREALQRERGKAVRVLERKAATSKQLRELEVIGDELNAGEEATDDTKRRACERLRLQVTVEHEQDDGSRWLIIEVLGHTQRIRLKKASAP